MKEILNTIVRFFIKFIGLNKQNDHNFLSKTSHKYFHSFCPSVIFGESSNKNQQSELFNCQQDVYSGLHVAIDVYPDRIDKFLQTLV